MADTSRNPGDSANFNELNAALRRMEGELNALRKEANAQLDRTEQAATRAAGTSEKLAGEAAARRAAVGRVEAAPAGAEDVSNARAVADAEVRRATAAEQTAQAKARSGEADAAAARNLPAVVGRERLPLGEGAYGGVRATPAEAIQAYGQQIAAAGRLAGAAPPPIPIAAAETRPGLRETMGAERVGAAETEAEAAANERLSSGLRGLGSSYGQVAYQARVYGDAVHRHGALTTEFLQALGRGEVTLREFGNELFLTAGKFAGWTIAATAIYGGARAFSALAQGAIQAQSATRGLERFIPNLNQGQATAQLLNVSRQLNVPVQDVGQSQQLFARVFPTETGSITAARTALLAYKLDQISVADATRYLTATTQEFGLTADRLPGLFDQISAAQRRMGARVSETLPGIARSAAAVKNAGGDLSQLVALIATAQVASGQTGNTVGTAFTRSAANFIRTPASQTLLTQLGIDQTHGYTQTLIDAVRRAQTLSGADRIALAKAIGGPQYGARIFQSLLNNDPRLERTLAVTSPAASRGSAQEELNKVLGQADERIKQIGNTLQRIGAELAGGGFANFAGLLLTTFDGILGDVDKMLALFNQLPGPMRQTVAYALELGAVARVLGKFGVGAQFADVPIVGRAFNATPKAVTEQKAALEGVQGLRADKAYALQSAQAGALLEAERLRFLETAGNDVSAATVESQKERAQLAVDGVETARTDLALASTIVATERTRLAALEGSVQWRGGRVGTAAEAAAGTTAGVVGSAGELAGTTEAEAAAVRGRLAATGAFLTSVAGGLSTFLFNPLTLILAASEGIPAIWQHQTQAFKDRQQQIQRSLKETNNQGDVQAILSGSQLHQAASTFDSDTIRSAYAAYNAELAVQARQQRDRAAGLPVSERFTSAIVSDFQKYSHEAGAGRVPVAALQAAYSKAETELHSSREALGLTANGQKKVALGQKLLKQALLDSVSGSDAVKKALTGADLDTIVASIQSDAEEIAQFGLTPARSRNVAQKYAAAVAAYARDPRGGKDGTGNLKAIKAAQGSLDNVLSTAQTELQQSLTLATTQDQRDTAYSTYRGTIQTQISAVRTTLDQKRADTQNARDHYNELRKSFSEVDKAYNEANKQLEGEQQAFSDTQGNPLSPQFAPRDPSRKARISDLKQQLDTLKKKRDDTHAAVVKQAESVKVLDDKLRVLERDSELQQTQEQNSIRDLRAQLQAGRESDAAAGLLGELRAAQADLTNDIKHRVGQMQLTQDELRVQQAQDQVLQAQVEQIASRGALRTSHIDPTNTGAVDQANIKTLQDEIRAVRAGPRSPERTKQLRDLETQLNGLRFQAAADVRQQAQDIINATFSLRESQTDDPVRQANLEVSKDRQLITLAHTRSEKLTAQANLNTALRNSYSAYVQSQLDEIDFRAHVGQITTEQEIGALQRLLHYAHLSRDARRNILTQIYDLQHQNQSDVELNVGNIRLPTLYDIRRLAGTGTSDPMTVQNINVQIDGAGDPNATALAVVSHLEKHTRTRLKGHHRAAAVR